ncbi:aminotransferase class IV [Candidatus Marinimicrobia bacterium MT.SAG.3]|nr:aminotransferase class IV [Candidatus Marinimicrobia bacterium MT.SAG.3]
MPIGTHDYMDDERNNNILIYINGELLPRSEAKISVFDSGFLLGDGVWEGIRLHNGKLVFGKDHLERLSDGAKALDIELGMSLSKIEAAVLDTTKANSMTSGVHIRLILTRGLKKTPFQHPSANVGDSTLVIIPEFKIASDESKTKGLRLFTVHVHRSYPDIQDPKLNSLSKLNCIIACIQADKAGYDEALMLDPHGFVSTCNSTNFFIVKKNEVWTSTPNYCLNGVTRGNIIRLCRENNIPVYEKDFSLMEVYSADESFVTGTFAGVIPVKEVDGRIINNGKRGEITQKLQNLYSELIDNEFPP